MKKYGLFLIMLIAVLAVALSSCTPEGNSPDGGGTNAPPQQNTGGSIAPGSKISIIFSEEESRKETSGEYGTLLAKIQTALIYGDVFYDAVYAQEGSTPSANEIIVGKSGRDVSKTAYERLERIEIPKEEEDEYPLGFGRWLVYAKDGSIAVAYDDDELLSAASDAVAALIDGYLSKDEIDVPDGVLLSGVTDYYSAYEKKDALELDNQWLELEARVGTDVVSALKNLYGIYSDDMIEWMANLWEPHTCICETEECTNSSAYCGGGAFYYSNSGRDTEGFLPDSESTRQILYFLESSGMVKSYTHIPESMKNGIVRFLKSLQDPESGYFYHPQWGNVISDSRRGRDLGDCTNLLVKFGSAPTYDAPNGVKGDGLTADGTPAVTASVSRLTERLGVSEAYAASKVVATAATPEHLVDKASFEAYLKSLDIRGHSYSVGNDLAAQISEIKQRDAVLQAEGADYSLVSILMSFLAENQNPETGTWHWPNESDQTDPYYANNGVLKISLVYNSTKTLIPNYTKLVNGAIEALMAEEDPGAVVDIYNVWYALSGIKGNIENYGGDEAKAHLATFLEELLAKAPTLIEATRDKLVIFLKPDGSFSYTPKYSSAVSQSDPVALPQSEEGDVNATTICAGGTLTTMFSALGISELRPGLYTSVDYKRFIRIIEDLDTVIKKEVPPLEVEATGDENKGKGKYYNDSLHFDNRFTDLVNQGLFYSQDDKIQFDRLNVGVYAGTTSVNKDKVMAYGKLIGGSPYLYMNLMNGKNGNAFIFETDICLIGGSTSYEDGGILQFWLDDDNETDTVMWWNSHFSIKQEQDLIEGDEPVHQHSFSPTMKTHAFNYGSWHNLRLEVQNAAAMGAEIRLYVDNILVNRSYVTEINTAIDHLTLRFRGDSDADSLVLFDNIFFGSFASIPADNTELVPDNIVIGSSTDIIAGAENRGSGVYASSAQGYSNLNLTLLKSSGKLGSQDGRITFDKASGGYYAIIRKIRDTGEAMLFGKTTTGDPYLFFYADPNEEDDRSLVFETDLALMSGTADGRSDNLIMQLYASKTEAISYWYDLGVNIKRINEKYYVSAKNTDVEISAAHWYNLRIEVDDTSAIGSEARIYLNGELIAKFNTTSAANYVPNVMIRFMSQCKDGRIYFDNTYFKAPVKPVESIPTPTNPPVGNETDNIGSGVYYDKSEKYEGRTHEGLISDGVMALNTNRGTGDKRTLSFSGGAMHYASTGSGWGAINFVKQNEGEGIVFETDIRLTDVVCSKDRPLSFVGTSNNGSGSAGLYSFTMSIYPHPDKAVGGYFVTIKDNTEQVAWIPNDIWVNIRYEFDDTKPGSSTRLLINGKTVLEAKSAGAITDIKGVELLTMSTSSSNGFISGTVSFDNTYMGVKVVKLPEPPTEPPTEGDDPVVTPPSADDYYGKGAYYNHAIKYEGATHASLISAGLMAENTNRGLGGKTLTFSDGAMIYAGVKSSWSAVNFIKRGGVGMVFETDIKLDGAEISRARATQLVGTSNNGTGNAGVYTFRISIYSDTDGDGYILEIKDSTETVIIPEGTWVNIRYEFEALTSGSGVKLYVNGELAIETVSSSSISGIAGVEMLHSSDSGADFGFSSGTITLDNTYCGGIIADNGSRGEGKYKDLAISYDGISFDELVTDGTITPVSASSAPASVVEVSGDDALRIAASGSSWARYSIKKVGTGTDMVFDTDVMIENYSSSEARYLYIMPTSNLSANASLYTAYIMLMPNSEGGYDIYLNDASDSRYTLTQGEWFNLRVEFDGLIQGSRFAIYINGTLLAEAALQKSISNVAGLQLQLQGKSGSNAGVVGDIYLDNTYLGDKISEQ